MHALDENHDLPRAKRNVIVLALSQALLGAQMPMIFILGGLAGQSLASNVCFATLPITMIVFGSATTAPWLSVFMQRFGRRAGFILGTGGAGIGAAICAYALHIGSFPAFLIGSYFSGIYMSAQGFFRFAALDTAPYEFRGRAVSYVLAGGLAAAIIGPTLVKLTSQAMVIPFLGSYLAVIGMNAIFVWLFFALDIPMVSSSDNDGTRIRTRAELLRIPRVAVAVIVAMISHSLMILVMTSTPLAVVGCGFTQANVSDIVSAHMLAMFVPSFFTGHLIERFGTVKVMITGLFLYCIAGMIAFAGIDLQNFFGTLVLLGVGWNFSFIGATSMLASAHTPQERGRVQGLNDLFVFGLVTIASAASGGLMNCSGSDPEHGWYAVNTAMVPLLLAAGGCLLWLYLKESRQSVRSGH